MMLDRDPDVLEHVSTDTMIYPMRDARFNLSHWHRVQEARIRRELDPQHDNDRRTT